MTALVPDLKITPRTGGYARGQEGVEQILRGALSVLVESGYKAMTLRRIAQACGMNVGNLNYYYKSKADLVHALLDALISGYEGVFDTLAHEPNVPADVRLERLVSVILQDITTKKTTRVFPELWALANHDKFVQERVDDLYARARVTLVELIGEINPALPADERETLALFISASLEGTTIFAGHGKAWQGRMGWIERAAHRSFVPLVKSLKPGELSGRANPS